MRIGELAAVSGVTAKTIRYYEDIGVLDAPDRTPSGYRHYTREADLGDDEFLAEAEPDVAGPHPVFVEDAGFCDLLDAIR